MAWKKLKQSALNDQSLRREYDQLLAEVSKQMKRRNELENVGGKEIEYTEANKALESASLKLHRYFYDNYLED